jgi:hypothetical protein
MGDLRLNCEESQKCEVLLCPQSDLFTTGPDQPRITEASKRELGHFPSTREGTRVDKIIINS